MLNVEPFCLDFFLNLTPRFVSWHLLTFPVQLRVCDIMKNRFSTEQMKVFVSRKEGEKEGEIRGLELRADNRTASPHHQHTQQPGCL